MRRLFIHCFIVWHLLAIGLWSLPDSPLQARLVQPFRAYLLWTGLWQGWSMFAPDPLRINIDLDATIAFQDGTHAQWIFPRMERLGIFERYQKERYRKWRERIREDASALVWPDTARFIARLQHTPDHIPVHVTLTRHWSDIIFPERGTYLPRLWPAQLDHSYNFFQYDVSPSDL